MNTQPQPKQILTIKAQHIGPIMYLDQKLSSRKQNLIFARSGTGKSFIARALRCLDQSAFSDAPEGKIPDLLVSEEATTGQGSFSLYEGQDCIAHLELNTKEKSVHRSESAYIFHVFSEDYVDKQLRNKLEELDGKITHQIIIGKESAELDEKETDLASKIEKRDQKRAEIDNLFGKRKDQLQKEFSINASLGSFRRLNTDVYFERKPFALDANGKSIKELLSQYNTLKSLPSDPVLPKAIEVSELALDMSQFQAALGKITSPSSVADEFKQKIASDQAFFEAGLGLYDAYPSECPFCTQGMSEVAIKAVTAYSNYFEDEEAKERRKINEHLSLIEATIKKAERLKSECLQAKIHFDDLKGYFPSFSQKSIADLNPTFDALRAYLGALQQCLEQKSSNLTLPVAMPQGDFAQLEAEVAERAEGNAKLFRDLAALVSNSKDERLKIQNAACEAFRAEFYNKNKPTINELRELADAISALVSEIAEMKKTHGASAPARERVVETFSLLLGRLFGKKYTFDGETFKVRRNNKEMIRGGDRTLSDGEKAAMAFCYFIAQTHLRVQSNDEYEKIYFVFDDPVSSMSFDYIYSIIQCLKFLRITKNREIQFNLRSDLYRPKMLILTHNNYFYNIASTNNVVHSDALLQLFAGEGRHELKSQGKFATPHLLQLKDVYDVCEGNKSPDHTTPNSIRSVVEGMWKFCRPDLQDFGAFVKFLISDHEIEIKSVLINDLCHGGKFDDPPHKEEDIKEAAKEAIEVVRRFAIGQLKNL